jgi:16S rRNA (guanine966-N2)-methyltransferase
MRVIAGENGGRRLVAPPGRATRPTSDRVREAVFSMLESSMLESSVLEGPMTGTAATLEGATVWDLFAGSGAMGIEALSRGAAHATFVDQARSAVSAVRANLAALAYGPQRSAVVCADVLDWITPEQARVDLVIADPPYAWQGWDLLLARLARLAHRRTLVLAETGAELALPPGWQSLRAKRYGGTVVTLARFSEDP